MVLYLYSKIKIMPSNLKSSTEETLAETMDNVAQTLKFAAEYHLECEVFATALLFVKENPECTVNEALHAGLNEWDI